VDLFERILILCTGNICRSPMAEALLRQRMEHSGRDVEVRSAGVGALEDQQADPPAQVLMQTRGLDISAHRARQVTPALARWADLILVMESYQREALLDIDPTARGKTFLLGHWSSKEVPDPFRQPEELYNQVLGLIEEGLGAWQGKL
jgi:protein-tyrosine phosphatase